MNGETGTSGGFTIDGLRGLVEKVNENPSLIEHDWREAFLEEFKLDEEEKTFLEKCPSELREYLQTAFSRAAEHIQRGGKANIKVVKDYEHDRHELYLTIPQEEGAFESVGSLWFRVVCCDANCRHWHWCWNSSPPTRTLS
jgi:hypothetical protein